MLPVKMFARTLALAIGLTLGACGGGGGETPVAAPTSLSYPSPATATAGQVMTVLMPTVTGTVTSYSLSSTSPALPAGISINPANGRISGTPIAVAAQATYVVVASNAAGNTTYNLVLTVAAPPAPTVNISFSPNPVVQGTPSTVTWSTTNATTCMASGAWSGARAAAGTVSISTAAVGAFAHTLTCQNVVAASGSASATLTVNEPPKFTLGSMTTRSVTGDIPADSATLGLSQFVDLDGDGWGDLFATGAYYPGNGNNPIPRPGYVAFGGPGGYTAAAQSKFPWANMTSIHAREFAFEDFNADGVRDIFVADHGYDAHPFPGFQNQLFLSQAGMPSWVNATANLPQQWDFTHSVCTGDVNADGNVDILANNEVLSDAYFLKGDGAGHFTKDGQILPAQPGQPLSAKRGLTSCSLTDLDGDGYPELILGTAIERGSPHILWNAGGSYAANTVAAGTITPLPGPTGLGSNWLIYEMQATDLNRDGRQDLIVVAQAHVWEGGWEFQFLVNQGNRQFVDETATYLRDGAAVRGLPTASNATWIQFLVPSDLNGDGRMDYWVDANASGKPLNENLPLALIRQADGHFVPIKVGELRAAAGNPQSFLGSYRYVNRGPLLPGEFARPYGQPISHGAIRVESWPITFR